MIPGTSRSGATIIGALFMGVERKAAAEFSFFLAIPTMLGVFVYEAYKGRHELMAQGGNEIITIAIGFIAVSYTHLDVYKRQQSNILTQGLPHHHQQGQDCALYKHPLRLKLHHAFS